MTDAGAEAKKEGMQRADDHANQRWLVEADHAIMKLAKERETFTADDVWPLLTATTHDGRALGPRFIYAVKQGWIAKKEGGFVLSTRAKRHQAPIQVWKSLLFKPARTS